MTNVLNQNGTLSEITSKANVKYDAMIENDNKIDNRLQLNPIDNVGYQKREVKYQAAKRNKSIIIKNEIK